MVSPVLYRNIVQLLTTQQVRLSEKGVHILKLKPWGDPEESHMSASDIEQVEIKIPPRGRSKCVVIQSDKETITVGHKNLSPEALTWLKNCIIANISK